MPRTTSKPRRTAVATAAPVARDASWAVWLTRAAFVLAAALVLARATMLETIRNPLDVMPGSESAPRGPGAAAGLLLDLTCCVPALLVLARRAFDPSYVLRFAWSFVLLALLGLWTVTSTAWAGDKFAAAVAGTHWLCAAVFLWSAAQLVRDWAHLRLVAAVAVGLLLAQAGQGLYYRFVEHPDLVVSWQSQRAEVIHQRGWDPDSFIARQFEKRVASDEIMGFTSSSNSYGAELVLLCVVAAGVALQRLADNDGATWAAFPAGAAALGLFVIAFVGSRTAVATPFLGAGVLAAVWVLRAILARHSRLAYVIGIAGVLLAATAMVGHGLYHGTLFHDSLTFRWRYWVAGARLFARHPLLGVGWENFGPHYLAFRLPIAAEEIKDPHNFLVRVATELGAVGLLLAMAWLARMGWDLTQPELIGIAADRPAEERIEGNDGGAAGGSFTGGKIILSPLVVIAAAGCVGMAINVLAGSDWSQPAAYNTLELIRRLGLLCLFVVGGSLAAIRSVDRQEADDRPAPWLLTATLVALGLFLLHNLIDFSLFEPGIMFVFMFLCGSALGARKREARNLASRSRTGARLTLAGACAAWLAALAAFAAPVAIAESHADAGDEALRTLRFEQSASEFQSALETVPYNADYAFRAARAVLADPRPPDPALALRMLDRAIALDPDQPLYWLHRANARLRAGAPDLAAVRADYEQALRLDPNNVDVRLEYADVLRRSGDTVGAAGQYREALRYNDLLSPDEPKRLAPQRVAQVQQSIREIGGEK